MTGTSWIVLRELLVHRYEDLKKRLTRQFGSEEIASETLHETWLHLQREGDAGPVHSPRAFVLRTAANLAKDRQRAERRRAKRSDIEDALQVPDIAPSPARVAQGKIDLQVVKKAIAELPTRAQTILIASRLQGLTHQEIAEQLGISRRTVLYELKRAVVHLEQRLEKKSNPDCTDEA
jgi:RNA polymerase sigma factor (sigma-70 family)